MNVLILSCGTGGGHDAAAAAVKCEFIRRGHSAVMLNPYELCGRKAARYIDHVYITLVQKIPGVFGVIYAIGNLYRRLPWYSPVYYANKYAADALAAYLRQHAVDLIVMTHLFPAEILTYLRNHGTAVPKTIFIATDYTCIPFTEETSCDAYVIPSPKLTQEFAGRGIPRNRIYPLGIPVDRHLSEHKTRKAAKLQLNFDPEKKYILIAGGSMGGGKIKKTVEALIRGFKNRRDVVLIILCGRNTKMYQKLRSKASPNTVVLQYTNDMTNLLQASDLFITKPGGLSSTEAAVWGIPIVHTAAIPGCETKNAGFFQSHGLSRQCGVSENSLLLAVKQLENPAVRKDMIQCQHRLIAGDAATEICRLAERMLESGTGIGS